MTSLEVMQLSPIVPVIALESVEDALPLAEALLEGGIDIMEITLRTDAGLQSIEKIAKHLPQMHVGAGTVINVEGVKKAVDYGAKFVFSPGISEALMLGAEEMDIPLIPGVATASDVMMALNGGIEGCKLFPATIVGGVSILKAFYGPFASMQFCPTGGVNKANMPQFLSLPNVTCVGGSWIVPQEAIIRKDFKMITSLCQEALANTGEGTVG